MSVCASLRLSSARYPFGPATYSSKDLGLRARAGPVRSPMPALPSEIWLYVFELVAYIPGILAISDVRAIEAFSEDYNGVILTGLYDDVMKAKLAISQVCWTWRRIMLPLLFEFVVIKSGRHTQKIAEALKRIDSEQPRGQCYGRWIKRLEIMSSDSIWDTESADALRGILEHTPNLLAFSDYFRQGSMYKGFCDRIVRVLEDLSAKGRLRRIDTSGGLIYRPDLLSNMASLEVLITSQALISPVELPQQLHTLVIANSEFCIPQSLGCLNGRKLRSLITRVGTIRSGFEQVSFRHIGNDTGLAIGLTHFRWFTSFASHKTSDMKGFRVTVSDMPALKSLTVDFASSGVRPFETFRIQHPTLERVNFANFPAFGQRLTPAQYEEGLGALLDFLLSLLKVDYNPSLRVIGFYRHLSWFESGYFSTDSRVPNGENFTVFSRFLDACKGRGIAVEASIGARDHLYGIWQPFRLGMVPRIFVTRSLRPHNSC